MTDGSKYQAIVLLKDIWLLDQIISAKPTFEDNWKHRGSKRKLIRNTLQEPGTDPYSVTLQPNTLLSPPHVSAFNNHAEKAREVLSFRIFVQANSSPTQILYGGYKHYLLPHIRSLKLSKLYVANAFYEKRVIHTEMVEESLKQLIMVSEFEDDDIVSEDCGDIVSFWFTDELPWYVASPVQSDYCDAYAEVVMRQDGAKKSIRPLVDNCFIELNVTWLKMKKSNHLRLI